MTADRAALRVEPLADDSLEERDGRLAIPRSGMEMNDEIVRSLRDVLQR